jgi:hypothetical protein
MKHAAAAATLYFLVLFALGFLLGTVRVLVVAPHIGVLGATMLEVPVMLTAAFFGCRWVLARWQVPPAISVRWAMALWFLVLLLGFEMLLGVTLFGRTLAEQWAALAAPAGLIGLTAQVIAALLPLFVGRDRRR